MSLVSTAPRSADEIGREWAEDLLPPGSAFRGSNVQALMRGLAGPRETLEGIYPQSAGRYALVMPMRFWLITATC